METTTILSYSIYISLSILTISLIFPFIRLFKGPSVPDRVLALDQISLIIVAIMLVDIILSTELVFVDIVLVISFILTLGAMIISKFLFKHEKK
ncbi:MAG: cation:proton antiporter [Marinilabiliaceae bacterium]|nr:cation:proton antiporter [Marinilabiliaceae bacterium]